MNNQDNGQAALEVALAELDGITMHVHALRSAGMTHEAKGAENAWLLRAIRVAMKPARTRTAAEYKVKLMKGNMYGWALHASEDNGLFGASCLIIGALGIEAHEWGFESPEDFEACAGGARLQSCTVELDREVIAAYRSNAKRRRLGVAIKRYEVRRDNQDEKIATIRMRNARSA